MSDQEKDVQQVLAEAEAIRSGGTAGAASPQAGAAHGGAPDGTPDGAQSPAWEQYTTEASLCAMYGDVFLRKFGCDPLGPDEKHMAVQAWAETLAKWFPSIKEVMGPELRLLTIYGLPVAGRMMESWMSVPSPESSGGAEAGKLHS
jgi:hypothetical protein